MSATTAPPGWHPDPSNPTGAFRWWDGTAWTAHTQQAPAAAPASALAPAPAATFGSAYAAAPPASAPSAYASTSTAPAQPYANQYGTANVPAQSYANPYGPATPSSPTGTYYQAGFGGPANLGFGKQNSYSLIAMGVAALYILIAMTSHIVIMGVIPVMLSIRAFKSRERLAPVALIAAIIAVVVAFAALR
jgi:hypothetical protein